MEPSKNRGAASALAELLSDFRRQARILWLAHLGQYLLDSRI